MNYKLEQLIANTNLLSEKDIYEIRQIFNLFDTNKKIQMLDNWDNMVSRIVRLKDSIRKEQEILLGKAIDSIERQIEIAKKSGYKKEIGDEISQLKQMI